MPLQGFLNAIIYGRTRDDFVQMMGTTGRFFAAPEDDSSAIHVIRYNSEYGEDDDNESSSELRVDKSILSSDSSSPTPLLDSGN